MAGKVNGLAGGMLSYFTRHRTAANLVLVIMLAAGLAAFPRMRAQYFPDIIIEDVSVSVAWSGAGAEDVDRAIVQVLEPALLAVEGVTDTSATSREGQAYLQLEFEPGWDMSRAADEVQAAVDAVNTLPEGAEDPNVRRGAWRDRVTDVVITGPVGVEQLGRFADELVTRLFAVGVTRTTINGVAAPETIVEVPSRGLIQNDVAMSEIAEAIASATETGGGCRRWHRTRPNRKRQAQRRRYCGYRVALQPRRLKTDNRRSWARPNRRNRPRAGFLRWRESGNFGPRRSL